MQFNVEIALYCTVTVSATTSEEAEIVAEGLPIETLAANCNESDVTICEPAE